MPGIHAQQLCTYTYHAQTDDILVTLKPLFMPSHSSLEDQLFVWCYLVRIENHGDEPCQLRWRHWEIVDEKAHVSECSGEGVVGKQPILNPGEPFEYTSLVPLTTPSGIMRGYYQMESSDGILFDVKIPTFSLDSPYTNMSIN